MALSEQGIDCLPDGIVAHRIAALADPTLPAPPLEMKGDGPRLPTREVRLTGFGGRCRDGLANHAGVNGTREWIGGVHLAQSR